MSLVASVKTRSNASYRVMAAASSLYTLEYAITIASHRPPSSFEHHLVQLTAVTCYFAFIIDHHFQKQTSINPCSINHPKVNKKAMQ